MRKTAKRKPKRAGATLNAPRASRGLQHDRKHIQAQPAAIRARSTAAIGGYHSPEERRALTFLMLPVVLMAFSVGFNQKVRRYGSPAPLIAMAPVNRVIVEPMAPAGIPAVEPRHVLVYPPPQPWLEPEAKAAAVSIPTIAALVLPAAPDAERSTIHAELSPDVSQSASPQPNRRITTPAEQAPSSIPERTAALWEPMPPIPSQASPLEGALPQPAEPAVCVAPRSLLQAKGGSRLPTSVPDVREFRHLRRGSGCGCKGADH